jgi:hypothetical protein
MKISDRIVAPYKSPERYDPQNEVFNMKVSGLRIRSEHAIGFLKGRFQSLKSLRVRIADEKTHKYATYWIAACIAVHNFALRCEAEERAEDMALDDDPFFQECIGEEADEEDEPLSESEDEAPRDARTFTSRGRLSRGKERREDLKAAWLRVLAQRVARCQGNV